MKYIISLCLLLILLTGCGYKIGDRITLSETTHGATSIESWDEAINDAQEDGTFNVGGDIETIFEGDVVEVVQFESDMVLIEIIKGYDEGLMLWLPKRDLELASK